MRNKILFLTLHTFSLTGGIEKVNRAIVKALADLKKDYQLLSMYDRAVDERYTTAKTFKGFKGNRIAFALSTFSRSINANVVILSHINLLVFAWLIKKLKPRTRIILMAHGIEVWADLAKWKINFLRKCEIWSVSNYTAAKIISKHQLSQQNISVLNNCLDPFFEIPTSFEKPKALLQRHKLTRDQPLLFTLTRLSSEESYKGYDRVLMAIPHLLKQFPSLHYLLAGKADAAEKQRVEDLINKLNLKSHVTLVGFLKDEELTNYYCLGDIFIMPSTSEGFGIVFIEAAACGAQVIGGNKDGSVDALLNGKLGTLVDPININEITSAIEKKLITKNDPMQLQTLCIANFGYAQYVDQIKRKIAC